MFAATCNVLVLSSFFRKGERKEKYDGCLFCSPILQFSNSHHYRVDQIVCVLRREEKNRVKSNRIQSTFYIRDSRRIWLFEGWQVDSCRKSLIECVLLPCVCVPLCRAALTVLCCTLPSHHISSYFILPCHISSHFTSHHHISSHIIWSCLISPDIISSHLILKISSHLILPNFTSPHLTSPHLISSHLTLYYLTLYYLGFNSPLSHLILILLYLISSHLMSSHLTSCHLNSFHLTIFHLILTHLILILYHLICPRNSNLGICFCAFSLALFCSALFCTDIFVILICWFPSYFIFEFLSESL